MKPYDHKTIEKKWQKKWEHDRIYESKEDKKKEKMYVLDMFPYISGAGLHVGHPKGYIATDIYSRFKRMQGYSVLHPMGFDAFGLPTENYAIKTRTNPVDSVAKNIERFKEQLNLLGFDYDWSREINTTDPKYYKWTQWIFLQLFKKGLAYESNEPINWCPVDKTGLANEDVEEGRCERCGALVEKKPMRQWMLRITDYAEKLLEGLGSLDWPESIKELQRNWIGKSEGVTFRCNVKDLGMEVEMYNSVPQTYRAETFTAIAPEHPLVKQLVQGTSYEKKVIDFVERINKKKAGNKFDIGSDLEGVFTGRYIENYAGTGRDLPIWVASYIVYEYGTGIVNCSAHDERDYAFAKKSDIPLKEVAEPFFKKIRDQDAVHPDLPLRERNAVVCVVKHWSEDKYLCLSWKKTDWKGFIIEGVEKGEDAVETAKRGIAEETGYQNATFVKKLGGIIHSQFYHAVKKENRSAHFEPLYFELSDGARKETEQHEKDLHEVVWVSRSEVSSFINREDMKLIWDRFLGKDRPIIKNGLLTEPVEFKGREWSEVRSDIITHLEENSFAKRSVNYKLRDWVFSRQRYWGEPIPLIHCEKCGVVPVPEKDLPVTLPKVKHYEPTGTVESPLASISKWVNVECPQCGGKGKRETNTMPQWAGSSWYYLRYTDPKNKKEFASREKMDYWLGASLPLRNPAQQDAGGVDFYVGGAEHATRHLIYARFWHKFLFDQGLVSKPEPFKKLQHVGLIMGEDGKKMSKRWGNVINPDEIVERFGADSLRVYEMFMGPFDQSIAWNTDNLVGARRFLERVWNLQQKISDKEIVDENNVLLHKTIKKVTEDIGEFKFNTAISQLMILVNDFEKKEVVSKDSLLKLLLLLAPFAPHLSEEVWSTYGTGGSIHGELWPTFREEVIAKADVTIAIQVNGKIRASIRIFSAMTEKEIIEQALLLPTIQKWVGEKKPKKLFYVPGRIVSIVV
ncbi:MAG TPA: class I tRNA ligase family protein [Candidatus Paceibacterota bacterium]